MIADHPVLAGLAAVIFKAQLLASNDNNSLK
jgi:hypothetical protein